MHSPQSEVKEQTGVQFGFERRRGEVERRGERKIGV